LIASWRFTSSNTSPTARRRCARCIGCVIRSAASFRGHPLRGGLAYTLARGSPAQRIFEKRYQQPYDWLIRREHLNVPAEILRELAAVFEIQRTRSFFPLRVPLVFCNLCIGLRCGERGLPKRC